MEIHSRRTVNFGVTLFFGAMVSFSCWAFEVEGQIQVAPPYPKPETLHVKSKRVDSCASEQISQSLLVSSEGGLQNAVISLKNNVIASPEGAKQSSALVASVASLPRNDVFVLGQKDCNFSPHILLVPQGQTFWVTNSDPLAHDVRAFDQAKMTFRLDMDSSAKPIEQKFEKPGTFTIRCGLHPWMHAFVVSTDHPYYAVTDEKGQFQLKEVPAGEYTLHIWHETLGERDVPVKVGESVKDFKFVFPKMPA